MTTAVAARDAVDMLYEFRRSPALSKLAIVVRRRGERLHAELRGPWGLWQARMVHAYFRWLDGLGPLRVDGRSDIWSLYFPPIPSAAHNKVVEAYLTTFLLRRQTPAAVTIGVTDACQYSCPHCSAARGAHSTGNGKRRELATAELIRVVQECLAAGCGNVTFTGGEPLLAPGLEELVAAVPADLAVTQVFTNGRALTDARAASLAAAGLHAVQVSVDSPYPAEHDRRRGLEGAFAAAERAVVAARRAGLLVGMSTYATSESVRRRDVLALARLAAEWGACELSVFDAIPTGRLLRHPQVVLSRSERIALVLQARQANKASGRRLRVVTQTWTNSGVGFARLIGCLAGHCQFHITSGGEFQPCDFMPITMGNVRDDPVETLWRRTCRHPAFRRHSGRCRMQSPAFRRRYIEAIPDGVALPYPMAMLSRPPASGRPP